MSSESKVIRATGLGKSYQIYESPRARLQQFLMPRVHSALGLRRRSYFREFHALHDVGFEIGRGETVGIIGRNGSGKSTLLQIICGILTPSAGSVTTHGRIAALLELGSGFSPDFTGRENVQLHGSLQGLSRRQIEERYDAIAAFAGIGDFMDQPIKTYSSGMVVRLAFAAAINVEPDILVVDEALAVGDTAFQQKCLHRIRQMQSSGVSILLVTHSANSLIEYCDRGLYLRRGELVMDGACRDVVRRYNDDLLQEEGAITMVSVETQPVETPDAPATVELVETEPMSHPMWIESAELIGTDDRPLASVDHGGSVRARFTVRVNEVVTEPCFGVQISSTDGIALWSATTQGMALSLPPLQPGRHRFTWDLKADFSGNRYVVELGAGAVKKGEYKRLHRLDYAGHFDVLPIAHAGGGWLAPQPRFVTGVVESEAA